MGTNIATLATDAPPVVLGDTQGTPPAAMVDTGEPDLSESALIAGGHLNEDGTALTMEPVAVASVSEAAPAEAAAKPDDAPEAEPKPEDAPKPPEEKPGTLNAQLRNQERALVQKKQAFAKERTEFAGFKAGVEQQISQARAQLETRRAEVEQAAKVLDAVRTDPVGLLRAIGWDDRLIAERLMNGGQPGHVEAQARVERDLAALRNELAAERQERDRERRAREESTLVQTTYTEFLSIARASPERWPVASQFSDAKLKREADRVADASGNDPTLSFADIMDKIEDEEGAEVARVQRAGKNGKPAARPGKPPARPGRTEATPTLTAADAGERATDDAFDALSASQEEIDRRTFEEIERIKANGGRK